MSTLLLIGCGGGGGGTNQRGEISGVVFDSQGFVVRDAAVYGGDKETVSNSAGVYILSGVPARDVTVKAEITKSGVRYFGQNVGTVALNERTKSVNITLVRSDLLASIHGIIRDVDGNRVQGVRVFVHPDDDPTTTDDDTVNSSAVAITNDKGEYSVEGLSSAINYRVQVNARTFNSTFDAFKLSSGEDRRLDYRIPDATLVDLPVPTGLQVTAFTSPAGVRSAARQQAAYAELKKKLRPTANTVATRTTVRGNPIEVDLFWDPIQNTGLLGYGIYRGLTGRSLRNVGFLRDPQATFYADNDEEIVENTGYSYAITALDTLYDGTYGETDASASANTTPLGDLRVTSVTAGTRPTFTWAGLTNATRFTVYLFDQYPSIGIDSIFDNYANPATGTSYTYDGAQALTRGRTYYYILVAESANLTAVSFSPVGTFTVP